MTTKKYGVFIGRFQPFHRGHESVIDQIIEDGCTPLILMTEVDQMRDLDKNRFLSKTRIDMIRAVYPDILIELIQNCPTDREWRFGVDSKLMKYHPPEDSLEGAQFIIYYHSKEIDRGDDGLHYIESCMAGHPLKKVDMELDISATEIRYALDNIHVSTLQILSDLHNPKPSNPFLNIKSTRSQTGYDYYYAERLGKDSVAFILHNEDTNMYGMVNEFKPPIDQFMITAFGGSLDSDKTLEEIVRAECIEESGYEAEDITYHGKVLVSTQMNQFCHLYLVTVEKFKGKTSTDPLESKASVVWMFKEEALKIPDWKANYILNKVKGD